MRSGIEVPKGPVGRRVGQQPKPASVGREQDGQRTPKWSIGCDLTPSAERVETLVRFIVRMARRQRQFAALAWLAQENEAIGGIALGFPAEGRQTAYNAFHGGSQIGMSGHRLKFNDIALHVAQDEIVGSTGIGVGIVVDTTAHGRIVERLMAAVYSVVRSAQSCIAGWVAYPKDS